MYLQAFSDKDILFITINVVEKSTMLACQENGDCLRNQQQKTKATVLQVRVLLCVLDKK